jgi:hypothetical protein
MGLHNPRFQSADINYSPKPILWCVNHYGPNNQLRDLVKCAIIAKMHGYILMAPPLFPHYAARMHQMQWFHDYYDLQKLNNFVNTITLDEYIRSKSPSSPNIPFDCYVEQSKSVAERKWYPKNTLSSVQHYFKMQIRFRNHINITTLSLNMSQLGETMSSCSSIFLHIHYTAFHEMFSTKNALVESVFTHITRTYWIRQAATQIIDRLSTFWHVPSNKTQPTKKLAVAHFRLGDHIVMNMSTYVRQLQTLFDDDLQVTHLHIMCPFLNATDVQYIAESLPIPFSTSMKIFDHVKTTFHEFSFSVLEQEVAFQAPIFIGSPWTTYSGTVVMQKIFQESGIVYMFSRKNGDKPYLMDNGNVKYST